MTSRFIIFETCQEYSDNNRRTPMHECKLSKEKELKKSCVMIYPICLYKRGNGGIISC